VTCPLFALDFDYFSKNNVEQHSALTSDSVLAPPITRILQMQPSSSLTGVMLKAQPRAAVVTVHVSAEAAELRMKIL